MAGPTQEALLEMRRQEMALLDTLVAAERRRQQTAMTPPEARILAEMIAEGRDVQSVPQGLFDVLEPPPAYAPYDTAPAREYQFGDVGSRMGEENLAAARDVFSNAGYVTRGMLPESVQSYVPPAVSYLPDMALGGLLGLIGGGEKVIGYGAEAVDAGVRNAVEGLGFNYRYAPGTGAQVLARDVLGGIDVSGVGPEARAMGAVLNAAGPAIRQGAIDRLNQPGPMPTTYSNPIPGFLVAPTDPAIQRGFRAFHGSPHDFDRFDMSKIGTGEGAQAYGHGLYFAENEGIARSYRDKLSRNVFYDGNPVASVHPMDNPQAGAIHSVAKAVADGIPAEQAMAFEAGQWRAWADPYLRAAQENPQLAAEAARRAQSMTDIASAIEALDPQKFVKNPGRMYEVQINADPNNFLDWDKPLSEQPAAEAAIGRYLERALEQPGPINEDVFRRFESGEMTGADVALMVGENTAPLREAGIPGIRYLDAGSRTERTLINGAPPENRIDDIAAQYINIWGDRLGRIEIELKADKSVSRAERADVLERAQDLIGSGAKITREPYGSRNYVVFDDKLIDIVRKYGIAGAATLYGVSAMDIEAAMAASAPLGLLAMQPDEEY